jgi:hypothetical protein
MLVAVQVSSFMEISNSNDKKYHPFYVVEFSSYILELLNDKHQPNKAHLIGWFYIF